MVALELNSHFLVTGVELEVSGSSEALDSLIGASVQLASIIFEWLSLAERLSVSAG